MAQINFNAAGIETTSRDPIEPGAYEAVVVESEMRPVKSGNGIGINLTFEIIGEGKAKGRKVWAWINYQHPKSDVQRIGQEELARLCKAVGIDNLNDTEQLHNLPLTLTVGYDKADRTRNVVKGYAPRAGAAVATQGASAATPGNPPWRR